MTKSPEEFRVLVCGGRRFKNREAVFAFLDVKHAHYPITRIIHGGARGADSFAGEWAWLNGVKPAVYPFGIVSGGGKGRNVFMFDDAQPHLVVAFSGGGGTCHMYDYAKSKGTCEVVWVEA